MQDGLVTVVVPVYKTEKYLDRCMESIVNQTYPKLEILLIDDGSPDNCPRMCEDWARKDSRVRVIHKENAGLGMARNTGIENATGECICFFDSDDYIAPETIEKARKRLVADGTDVAVFGNLRIAKDGTVVKHNVPHSPVKCYFGEDVQNVFLPDLVNGKHRSAQTRNLILSVCNCLISLDLIHEIQWRFVSERENISEDSYAVLELYRHVKGVSVCPEAFYYHCENENSLTQVYRADRYEKICHAYSMNRALIRKLGYCEAVEKSAAALFLGLAVAAMKQIAASDLKAAQKKKLLADILKDDTMQAALQSISDRQYEKTKEIMYWTMRHKLCGLCYGLLMVRGLRN